MRVGLIHSVWRNPISVFFFFQAGTHCLVCASFLPKITETKTLSCAKLNCPIRQRNEDGARGRRRGFFFFLLYFPPRSLFYSSLWWANVIVKGLRRVVEIGLEATNRRDYGGVIH